MKVVFTNEVPVQFSLSQEDGQQNFLVYYEHRFNEYPQLVRVFFKSVRMKVHLLRTEYLMIWSFNMKLPVLMKIILTKCYGCRF